MTEIYACIVRESYQVLSVEVALSHPPPTSVAAPGDPPPSLSPEQEITAEEGSRFFPRTKTFGFMIVRDMLGPDAKGSASGRASRGVLSRSLSELFAAWQQADKAPESFCTEYAAQYVEETRLVKTEEMPMSAAEFDAAVLQHLGALKRSPQPKAALGKWWDHVHGGLPRALYAIRLRDVAWLRDIGKNIYFASGAYSPPGAP